MVGLEFVVAVGSIIVFLNPTPGGGLLEIDLVWRCVFGARVGIGNGDGWVGLVHVYWDGR